MSVYPATRQPSEYQQYDRPLQTEKGRKYDQNPGCCTKSRVCKTIAMIVSIALIAFGALLLFCPPVAVGLGLAALVKLPTATLFVLPEVTKAIAAGSIFIGSLIAGITLRSMKS